MDRAKYSRGFLNREKDDLTRKLLQLEHEKSRNKTTETLNLANIQKFRYHESKYIIKSGHRSDLKDKKFQKFVERKNVESLVNSSRLVKKIEKLETGKLTKRRKSSTFSDIFKENSLPRINSASSSGFSTRHVFDVYLEDEEDLKNRMRNRERLPSLINTYTNSIKYSLLDKHHPTNNKSYNEVLKESISLQTKFSPKVNMRTNTLEFNGKKFSLKKNTNQKTNISAKFVH
jgi:hypothetical protein